MGMSESKSWSSLRENIKRRAERYGRAVDITRVENMVGAGVFDTNLSYFGRSVWLEGKHLPQLPVRESTLIKTGMSDKQAAFATRRLLAGEVTYLWLRVSSERRIGDKGWYLFPLNSTDVIRKVEAGMPYIEVKAYWHLNADDLARTLLDRMALTR